MVSEAPTLKVPIPVGHNPRILADTPILAREAIPPREAILIRAREDIRTPGDAGAGYRPYPNYRPGYDPNASDKSRLVALLLCWFFGILGVHRFYVGKAGTGIAMIFTFGGFGIWAIIDLIMIAAGAFTDIDGRSITQWDTAR